MTRRITLLSCCLVVVPVSIAAADNNTTKRPTSPTLANVNAALQPGPVRKASLDRDAMMTFVAETTATRPLQDTEADKSWVERHPVWTGALVGFGVGFGVTYLATDDSDEGELLKVMSPSAAGIFWGGVCAGVGALAGWGIGRN
jgi:hypothetical protein